MTSSVAAPLGHRGETALLWERCCGLDVTLSVYKERPVDRRHVALARMTRGCGRDAVGLTSLSAYKGLSTNVMLL